MKKRLFLAMAGFSFVALSVSAVALIGSRTFRTTGSFIGVTQGSDHVTSNPQFDRVDFAGRNLVNLAMGREATDTNSPNQVLAMTFECDLNAARLVVYDRAS